jgi:hypothetical protein
MKRWWRAWWQTNDEPKTDEQRLHGYRAIPDTVIEHLDESIYSTVYEGKDPLELAHHNGRRSAIHEIFMNVDMARNPEKYRSSLTEGTLNG